MLSVFAFLVTEKFKGVRLENIGEKHINWFVELLKNEPSPRTGRLLSTGRQKNILSALRWLLEQTGKSNLLPKSNARLGIKKRVYVAQNSRAIEASDALINEVENHNIWIATSLRLSREFGLRFEESIKIRVSIADCGDALRLQGSWCKGGVPRSIPIRAQSQRDALDRAHELSGSGSLCPAGSSYIEHARAARNLINLFGIHRVHGLRHAYAQLRYAELTGWKSPAVGGPSANQMTLAQYARDRAARLTISNELGHGRVSVTNVYIGSASLIRPADVGKTNDLLD